MFSSISLFAEGNETIIRMAKEDKMNYSRVTEKLNKGFSRRLNIKTKSRTIFPIQPTVGLILAKYWIPGIGPEPEPFEASGIKNRQPVEGN
jgi:hypothetical protein